MGEEGCMEYPSRVCLSKVLPKILAKNPVTVFVDTQGKL